MIVSWRGCDLNVRRVEVKPSGIHDDDLIVMDSGIVRCLNISHAVTIEHLKPFLQFLFETEDGDKFPVHNLTGRYEVLRK